MEEELVKALSAEDIVERILECKLEVWKEIKAIKNELDDGEIRMSNIEATLEKHETQRNANAVELKFAFNEIKEELKQYRRDFKDHDRVEMEKYEVILDAIEDLRTTVKATKDETDLNTIVLHEQQKQDAIAQEVKKIIDTRDKPYHDVKKKVIMTMAVIVTGAVMTGLFKLVVLVVTIDSMITGAN